MGPHPRGSIGPRRSRTARLFPARSDDRSRPPPPMSTDVPSLAGAGWLIDPAVTKVFAALGVGGDETRVIGGAVRNALMGLAVTEMDFATTATPDEVEALSRQAGLRTVPTGREHGTLTLLVGSRSF